MYEPMARHDAKSAHGGGYVAIVSHQDMKCRNVFGTIMVAVLAPSICTYPTFNLLMVSTTPPALAEGIAERFALIYLIGNQII